MNTKNDKGTVLIERYTKEKGKLKIKSAVSQKIVNPQKICQNDLTKEDITLLKNTKKSVPQKETLQKMIIMLCSMGLIVTAILTLVKGLNSLNFARVLDVRTFFTMYVLVTILISVPSVFFYNIIEKKNNNTINLDGYLNKIIKSKETKKSMPLILEEEEHPLLSSNYDILRFRLDGETICIPRHMCISELYVGGAYEMFCSNSLYIVVLAKEPISKKNVTEESLLKICTKEITKDDMKIIEKHKKVLDKEMEKRKEEDNTQMKYYRLTKILGMYTIAISWIFVITTMLWTGSNLLFLISLSVLCISYAFKQSTKKIIATDSDRLYEKYNYITKMYNLSNALKTKESVYVSAVETISETIGNKIIIVKNYQLESSSGKLSFWVSSENLIEDNLIPGEKYTFYTIPQSFKFFTV